MWVHLCVYLCVSNREEGGRGGSLLTPKPFERKNLHSVLECEFGVCVSSAMYTCVEALVRLPQYLLLE